MKKEIYNQVAIGSVLLNERINELKACQEEKESILKWIDELTKKGLLEKSAKEIRNRMSANLERFRVAVSGIEKLYQNNSGGSTGVGVDSENR